MQCVIYEKIKMLKIFHFPCIHGNLIGGVTRYEKKPIFGHFLTITTISPTYIETYTVIDKFEMLFWFHKTQKHA